MWFFTSTPRRRTIWSTASLDMPSSLATSYTRGFFGGAGLAMALPLHGRCGFRSRLGRGWARSGLGCRLHLGRELHLAARRLRADRRMRLEVLLRGGDHLLRGLVSDARDLHQLLERRGEQLLHRLDPGRDQFLGRRLAELELLDLDAGQALMVLAPPPV